jgi:hypothetical protein
VSPMATTTVARRWLTWQKSAEAIVPAGMQRSREGPNTKRADHCMVRDGRNDRSQAAQAELAGVEAVNPVETPTGRSDQPAPAESKAQPPQAGTCGRQRSPARTC